MPETSTTCSQSEKTDAKKLAEIEAYIRRYRYRHDFGHKDGRNGYVDDMLAILGKSDPK